MIGQELGGRYEVIDRIGGGGMAIVYKAHDILLHRKVAIKVLRQQYVHDEDFIRRFRREAQSAASLSHPNVVSIYDVGQEEDTHYIVMEYIEGSNLNEKIIEKAPFQVEEAIHIASQICEALDHAHHNQIIHRDIKPHNILIGKNGRVKVTDFGIARAATASDITQTGSVIGSVHYFSPEHAKGISQGEKSDIYSLGIVMYQMLTNKLPFLGESPISVALKHLQDKVEEPRKVNPLIPQSVENIILKALRKTPEERYDSAKVMLEDLDTCLLPENQGKPKAVFSVEDESEDADRTLVMPAIRSDRPFAELYEDDEEKERVSRPWIKPLIWTVILSLLLIFGWVGVNNFIERLDLPKDVEVPYVIGYTLDEARVELEKVNLFVEDPIVEQYDEVVVAGIVLDQNKEDMEVKERSKIRLTVSMGMRMEVMPDYLGQKWVDVERSLKHMELTDEQIELTYVNDEAPTGEIIAQIPPKGEEFNPKDVLVEFTVSEGLGTVDMPDLIGKRLSEAEALLEKADLKLDPAGPTWDSSFSVPEGQVYHQFPANPGEPVSRGEEIKIWISSGYPEDALSPVVNVEVEPEVVGEPSIVKISIRDAREGETKRDPVEITDTTTFPVTVVVSPDTPAVITILVNDKFDDSISVSYKDAQEQGAGSPKAMNVDQADSEGAN